MTPIPKPSIQEAVSALSDRDEFKVIIEFLRDERERFIADFRLCVGENDVMKLCGSISTLDEVVSLLSRGA